MTAWLFVLFSVVVVILLIDAAIHLFYARAALPFMDKNPGFLVLPPPADAVEPEPIRFPTTHHLQLDGGIYYPPEGHPRGIIIFCPETDGSYTTAINYTAALVESGFAVMALTFRNQGDSEHLDSYRATHWVSEYEVMDVHAAINFVSAQPQFQGLPIGLFGVSRGAGAALAAAATRPEVQTVLAQGAFSNHSLVLYYCLKWVSSVVGSRSRFIPNWHIGITSMLMLKMLEHRNHCHYIRLESFVPALKRKSVLFIRGARDNYVPRQQSENLCRLSGRQPNQGLWMVPKAKHNMERVVDPATFDERVVSFFNGMAPAPVTTSVVHRQAVATH